jgi:hypothetical protein
LLLPRHLHGVLVDLSQSGGTDCAEFTLSVSD